MTDRVIHATAVNKVKTTGAGAKRKSSKELLDNTSVASTDTSTGAKRESSARSENLHKATSGPVSLNRGQGQAE